MSERSLTPLWEELTMPGGGLSQPSSPDHPLWKLHRRLAWLKHVGALGPKELYLDHEGLPSFEGMVMEHGDFTIPPLVLPDPPIQGPAGFGNYPSTSSDWLGRMISTLNDRGKLTHVAWKGALDKLQKLALLPHDPSAFIPLKILSAAKISYNNDRFLFEHFVHNSSENHMLLLNKECPVSGWSAQRMARMVGFEAPGEHDRKWWRTSGTEGLIEEFDEKAYICIHRSWHLINKGHDLCYHSHKLSKGLEVATLALEHLETFGSLRHDAPVLAGVESHIRELRGFIQAKGLGGYLPPSS
ncbi:hypothetical protein CEP52_009016 [Fusarium oligoseptatum]|uniref:Uncharacterized protein n=1 Tax=Fusarium oligoseptatum TaxID=2604345 RepID=A0A428TF66_9HYPO|nr:hypothetical protein CEP52_009016 [Fusarium oligoseptatum]